MKSSPATISPAALSEVFSPAELQNLAQKIEASGALGRSKIYVALLEYLLNAATTGKSPKEIEIALDVLGRNSSFDVTRDSVVRVYIHQLRKRLDEYYLKHDSSAPYRIVIPKGQYTIAVMPVTDPATAAPEGLRFKDALTWRTGLLASFIVLLAANLISLLSRAPSIESPVAQLAQHQMWSAVLDDDIPVLLVMGDYYIFGELDESGRIDRMVRDFNINSPQDLNSLFMSEPDLSNKYMNLDLNYMPEGSAHALASIMPILQWGGKTVNVTMMSKLSTTDLRSHHIIYIGYISAFDKLARLIFASSGLQTGRTYDELYNRGSGEIYSSDAALPTRNQPFRDYGLISTFPAPTGNQFIVIAGTRDAGLMHTAQIALDKAQLDAIEYSLQLPYSQSSASFEALYEVFGFDRTNFDANLIYSRALDPRRIWSGEATPN
jgi:hypothetical protein